MNQFGKIKYYDLTLSYFILILTSLTLLNSTRTGISSFNASSRGSDVHVFIDIPLEGYKRKFYGVLSIIMVLFKGLPNLFKSFIRLFSL